MRFRFRLPTKLCRIKPIKQALHETLHALAVLLFLQP